MSLIENSEKNEVKQNEIKFTEIKTLDNSLLQKYDVKLYGSDKDTYNIINDFLEDNQSERAF